MKQYEVTARTITLNAGRVKLTDAQARDRAHNLRHIGGGAYEILRPINFKMGEKLGFDGDVRKDMASELMTPEQAAAAREAAARAEAEAKAKAAAATRGKADAKAKKEADAKAAAEAEAKARAEAEAAAKAEAEAKAATNGKGK